jgi:hypothetical protein
MRALCIREPWASLICSGRKTVETRTWYTRYRGSVLLVASKTPKGPLSGHAFAVARIVDVRLMTQRDEAAACCEVYPRARSWQLAEVRPIKPVPQKGRLGLYHVEGEPEAFQ